MNTIEPVRIEKVTSIQAENQHRHQAQRDAVMQKQRSNTVVRRETVPQQNDSGANVSSVPTVVNNQQPSAGAFKKESVSYEELQEKLTQANTVLEVESNKQLSFFVDKDTGKQGVRVIDMKTKEVIKQIPPEQMLDLTKRIKEQLGVLLDEVI